MISTPCTARTDVSVTLPVFLQFLGKINLRSPIVQIADYHLIQYEAAIIGTS